MDTASIASAALSMQAAGLQSQLAMRMMKMNADAAKELVATLLTPQTQSAPATGTGAIVDRMA